MPHGPRRIVTLVCLAEALSMTGFAAYPAFLTELKALWGMSGTEAGFVGGAFFFGYMVAVPFLTGITDRLDARQVFVASCFLAVAGMVGFAAFARGAFTAAAFQALTGAGLAGTYMPGLKALTDRVQSPRQSRYIAFYTATFGIGTSLSLILAGQLGKTLPWSTTVTVLAVGPLLAAVIFLVALPPQAPEVHRQSGWLPRFGDVLEQKQTRTYILGYGAHCWELFGLRSWMVAFIAFGYSLGSSQPWLSATEAAAAINLLGLPASILGNEAAGKLGRKRWIAGVMLAAALLCWLAGFAASAPWWLMLLVLAIYFVAVMADSASLTAGLVEVTPPAQRGAAMALYSLLGFGAGFVAPLVFGVILDVAENGPLAWGLALGSLGLLGLGWSVKRVACKGTSTLS
jgi:MFS family permease